MRERTAIIRPFLDFIFKHCTSGIYLAMKSQALLNMAIRTSGYLKDHKINDKIIREKITLQDFQYIIWSRQRHSHGSPIGMG